MARIIDAFTQFFDDNGDPLVDGWLKFTVSGTNNTDKDTFADSGETIANANPVQLSGSGRCPNVFGTGSYNVRSYTDNGGSPGVQIQQFDPVGGDTSGGAFSEWLSATIYGEGDIVIGSDDKYYRSLVASNQNNDPTISPQQWEEVQLTGVYNQFITYSAGEVVIDSSGYLYRSLVGSNINNTPSDNPDEWGVAILQTELLSTTITHNMTVDADYTLTLSENRNGRIVITDSGVVLTGPVNIIVSDIERTFIAQNDTAQTLTFKTSAGTGAAVPAGEYSNLVNDGADVLLNVGYSSETQRGIIEIATQAEVDAGTDDEKAITPLKLNALPYGKLEIIESWTPTAVASKDFTWDEALYSEVLITFEGLLAVAGTPTMSTRFGHTDGGTILSAANYNGTQLLAGTASALTSQTSLRTAILSSTANLGAGGNIRVHGSASAAGYKGLLSMANERLIIGYYEATTTVAYDTVRLLLDASTFVAGSGKVNLYGIRSS